MTNKNLRPLIAFKFLLKLSVIYILLGLMQLWITWIILKLGDEATSFRDMCCDGVLLFFATALFASALDLLLDKKLNQSSGWILSALLIGFGTLALTVALFTRIFLVSRGSALPADVEVFNSTIFSFSIGAVGLNLIFLLAVRAAGSPDIIPPQQLPQTGGDL